MAFRSWQLCVPTFVFALSLGCLLTDGTDATTSTTIGIGTDGSEFEDDGFDSGFEGGLLGECEQYIQACAQDPYCACFLDCVVENALAGSDNPLAGCLEKCQLGTTPYWAEQYLVCVQGELELPDPNDSGEGQDTLDGGQDSAGTQG